MPYELDNGAVTSIPLRDLRKARQLKKHWDDFMPYMKNNIYYVSPDGSTRELIE